MADFRRDAGQRQYYAPSSYTHEGRSSSGESEFDFTDTVSNLINGFIGGFTTINVGDEPTNRYEAIARSLGHLAGFIGFIPGLGTLGGKAAGIFGRSARGIFSTAKVAKAVQVAGKTERVAQSIVKAEKSIAEFASVPMAVAGFVGRQISQRGGAHAGKIAAEYLTARGVSAGAVAVGGDIMKGAFHLGTASAVSSWQQGSEAMADSFVHGAIAGGGFRLLGNVLPGATIPTGRGIVDRTSNIFRNAIIADKNGNVDWAPVARVIAASAWTGLPSTMRNETPELQIYEYLLGAYFGLGEMSVSQKNVLKKFREWTTKSVDGTNLGINGLEQSAYNYKNRPEYKEMPPKEQEMFADLVDSHALNTYSVGKDSKQIVATDSGYKLASTVSNIRKALRNDLAFKMKSGEISSEEYQKQYKSLLLQDMGESLYIAVENEVIKIKGDKKHKWHKLPEEEIREKVLDTQMTRMGEDVNTELLYQRNRVSSERDIAKLEKELAATPEAKLIMQVQEELVDMRESGQIFLRPIRVLALKQFQNSGSTEVVEFGRMQVELAKIVKDHAVNKKPFNELTAEVQRITGVSMEIPTSKKENPEWKSLRHAFEIERQFMPEPIPQLRAEMLKNGGWELKPAGLFNVDGDRIAQWKAQPYMWKILGEGVEDFQFFNIKYARVYNKKKRRLEDVDFYRSNIPLEALAMELYRQGLSIAGGAKDDANIMATSFLPGAESPEKARETLLAVTTWVQENRSPQEMQVLKDTVAALSARFVREVGHQKADDLLKPVTVWAQQYANNWLSLAKLNSMTIPELLTHLYNGEQGFLADPLAWNKRLSLLNNGFRSWDRSFFSNVVGAEEGIRTVIVNALNKNGESLVEGIEDLKYYVVEKNPDGSIKSIYSKLHDAHLDGVVYLRDEVFEAMALQGALDVGSSAQKGTLTHTEAGKGLLLGKYAYHRAGKVMSAEMVSNGLDAILNTTSVKFYGTREVVDSQWRPKAKEGEKLKFTREQESTEDFKFVIPHEAFTYTEAGEHIEAQLRPSPLLSQQQSGLDAPRFGFMREWLREMSQKSFDGVPETNEKLERYLANPNSVDLNELNVREIGVQKQLDILHSGQDSPIFRKIIDGYLQEPEGAFNPIISNEGQALARQFMKERSAAETILDLSQHTPAVMFSSVVQKYVTQAIKNKIIAQIMTPKVEGSFLSVLQPYRSDLMSDISLKEGEIMLGDSLRDYKIPWSVRGEKEFETIEKALTEYNDALANKFPDKVYTPKQLEQMLDDLAVVVQRVPTDSPSGIRALKIIGFHGLPGTGIVVHPEDMRNLGGADLDIDKAFIFTRVPKQGKDELREAAWEWYDWYDIKAKKQVDPKTKRYILANGKLSSTQAKEENIVKVMKESKDNDYFLDKTSREVEYTPVDAKEESVSYKSSVARIISGGQTGGDLGGLEAGKELGLETGGTAPPNWISGNKRNKALLESYGLVEGEPDAKIFPKRTMKNVDDSDGTVAFLWGSSVGTKKTIEYAQTGKWSGQTTPKNGGNKPVIAIKSKDLDEAATELRKFINENNIKTLNIAGHREQSQPGIQKFVKEVVKKALSPEVMKPTVAKQKTTDAELNKSFWSMADVGMLGLANKVSYQGAQLLGPGINYTKNLGAIIDIITEQGLTLERMVGEEERIQTGEKRTRIVSKIKLKDLDTEAFFGMKRTFTNRSADASSGERLVDAQGAADIFVEALFRGKVSRKMLEESSIFQAIRSLNRFASGVGEQNEAVDLGEIVKGARKTLKKLPIKLGNPFFAAASRLGDLEDRFPNYPFVGKQVEVQFDRHQKAAYENPEMAFLAGRWKGNKGVKGDAMGVVFFNDFTKSKLYKEAKATSPYTRMLLANELISQSFWDRTFFTYLNKVAPVKADPKKVEAIYKEVDALKQEFFQERAELKSRKQSELDAKLSEILPLIDKKLVGIKNKFPREYHDFIDGAMLSSLTYQGKSYPDFSTEIIAKETKRLNKWRAKGQKKIDDNVQKLLERGREGDIQRKKWETTLEQSYNKKIKRMKTEIRTEWYDTNMTDYAFRLTTINKEVITNVLAEYNTIVQKLKTQISTDDLLSLKAYAQTDYITESIRYPSEKEAPAIFKQTLERMAKEQPHGRMPKALEKKLDKAMEVVTAYYMKYPDELPFLEAQFAGETFRRKGNWGYAGAIPPYLAEPKHVFAFAELLQARLRADGQAPPSVTKTDWWLNAWKVGNKLLPFDRRIVSLRVPIKHYTGLAGFGEIQVSQSHLRGLAELHNTGQVILEGNITTLFDRFEDSEKVLLGKQLNNIEAGLGDKLFNYEIANLEKNYAKKSGKNEHYSPIYQDNWNAVKAEYEALLKDPKVYSIPFLGNKPMNAKQIFTRFRELQVDWSKKVIRDLIANNSLVESFFSKRTKDGKSLRDRSGYLILNNVAEALRADLFSGKPTFYTLELIERIKHQVKLEKIGIKTVNFFNIALKRLHGKAFNFTSFEGMGNNPEFRKLMKEYTANRLPDKLSAYERRALKFYVEQYQKGKEVFAVGEMPTQELKAETWDSLLQSPKYNYKNWMQYKDFSERIRDWGTEIYFPHSSYSEKSHIQWLENLMVEAREGGSSTQDQTTKALQGIKEDHLRSVRESTDLAGSTEIERLMGLLESEPVTVENIASFSQEFSHTMHRNQKTPVPGWKRNTKALLLYEQKAVRVYWSFVNAFVGRDLIQQFEKSAPFGNKTEAWSQYMHIYNRDQVGHPSVFPDAWKENPDLGLRYNPYMLLTDDFWSKKLKGLERKGFKGEKLIKDFPNLTVGEVNELVKHKDVLKKLYYNDVVTKLRLISNLEAKFELMTLLSHPKTFINNMLGGSTNTIVSSGARHFKNALDIAYLKENVFLDFKSKDDVLEFVKLHGGIDAMFSTQFGLDQTFKSAKYKELEKRVLDYIRSGKTYQESTIKELIKDSGLSDAILTTAGWFMRSSEVRLRSRAWMAHYLNVRETMNASGMILEKDHPWLIQWANKGVAATQFMYNNANRAPFARTSLGKIFSRFQLWAWNSLKFRRDIHALAYEEGYAPDSVEFKRLQRLVTADLFVFGLAKAFAMSMFDNTLPPPLDYLSDLGQFFFGDDDKKQRAFFGSLPYPANIIGIVSPPITRLPFATITALINGDLDAYAQSIVSWIPGGRLGQSIYRTGDSPITGIQNFTGFPLTGIQRYQKKLEKLFPDKEGENLEKVDEKTSK